MHVIDLECYTEAFVSNLVETDDYNVDYNINAADLNLNI